MRDHPQPVERVRPFAGPAVFGGTVGALCGAVLTVWSFLPGAPDLRPAAATLTALTFPVMVAALYEFRARWGAWPNRDMQKRAVRLLPRPAQVLLGGIFLAGWAITMVAMISDASVAVECRRFAAIAMSLDAGAVALAAGARLSPPSSTG